MNITNGHFNTNTFHLTEATQDLQIAQGTNNSVILSIKDLSASVHSGDFWYKEIFMVAEGAIDAKITNMSVSVELQNGLQTLANGKVGPKFEVIGSSVELKAENIDITIHGNAFSEFINVIKTLFMGMVEGEINTVLKEQLAPAVNDYIKQYNGTSEVYNKMDVDWSMNMPARFDQN